MLVAAGDLVEFSGIVFGSRPACFRNARDGGCDAGAHLVVGREGSALLVGRGSGGGGDGVADGRGVAARFATGAAPAGRPARACGRVSADAVDGVASARLPKRRRVGDAPPSPQLADAGVARARGGGGLHGAQVACATPSRPWRRKSAHAPEEAFVGADGVAQIVDIELRAT